MAFTGTFTENKIVIVNNSFIATNIFHIMLYEFEKLHYNDIYLFILMNLEYIF